MSPAYSPFASLPPEILTRILRLGAQSSKSTAQNLCLVSSWVWDIALERVLDTVVIPDEDPACDFQCSIAPKRFGRINPRHRHVSTSLRSLALLTAAKASRYPHTEESLDAHAAILSIASALEFLVINPSLLGGMITHSSRPIASLGKAISVRERKLHLILLGDELSGYHFNLNEPPRRPRFEDETANQFFASVTHLYITGYRFLKISADDDPIPRIFPSLTHLVVNTPLWCNRDCPRDILENIAISFSTLTGSSTFQMVVFPGPSPYVQKTVFGDCQPYVKLARSIDPKLYFLFTPQKVPGMEFIWRRTSCVDKGSIWEKARRDTQRIMDWNPPVLKPGFDVNEARRVA